MTNGSSTRSGRHLARAAVVAAAVTAERLIDALYPGACGCGAPLGRGSRAGVCARCWRRCIPAEGPACDRCANPLGDPEAELCDACRRRPPAFARARAGWLYAGPLPVIVHRFKFAGCDELAAPLSELLLAARPLWEDLLPVDLVVPVPLPLERRLRRGFNQAALLARPVARALGLPVRPGALWRRPGSRPQSDVAPGERGRNVRDRFRCVRRSVLAGRRVLLVDDVLTTGATAQACAAALRAAGAAEVGVLALARTPGAGLGGLR